MTRTTRDFQRGIAMPHGAAPIPRRPALDSKRR